MAKYVMKIIAKLARLAKSPTVRLIVPIVLPILKAAIKGQRKGQ